MPMPIKPDLEIFLRKAAAVGPLRSVRSKLFANRAVPLSTRRTLLCALGLSRFIHGSGALHLNQKGHQRTWNSTCISLWAHLIPSVSGDRPHSFQVLYVSKAPPPHLFLALQRANLLAKLLSKGFATIVHMLQLEWELAQEGSWLSQFVSDIAAVAQWVPAIQQLGQRQWPLHELCAKLQSHCDWWTTAVRQAIKAYAADVVEWKAVPRVLAVPNGGVYRCHLCDDTFGQRSFLTVHLARKHQLYAPARHFAPGRQCVACLKTFSTVLLAQAHLRRNPRCFRRAVWLMEPLELEAVKEFEAADKLLSKKIRGGGWQQQVTATKVQQGEGPLRATAVDVELDPEPFSIQMLAKQFWPRAGVVDWIEGYLAAASRAGPRQRTSSWWLRRPSQVNSFST